MKLFQHNRDAYYSALEMLQNTNKAAIIHPTGTGKSFIGFKLCEDHPSKTICWLSPSEYIFKTQIENWQKAGGEELKNVKFFTYAKLMGLTKEEIADIQPSYIVLDEFHRCGAEMWGQGVNRLIDAYSSVPILGLSATAIRYLDNQRNMADELFDNNIASEMTLGEAIVRGILKAPTYVLSVYSYTKDLRKYQSRVNKAKSRAVRDEAQKYLDALRRALDKADGLNEVFRKHIKAKDGKYIVFCSNVEHMGEMVEKVPEWFGGIDDDPHIYVVYSDNAETSKEFKNFKEDDSEHLKLLFCIDMLNEGVHVEKIDGVILFRPTISPIIYKQQIGRALSASKDKEPIIFDVVNNIENLYSIGTVEQEMQVAINYYRSLGLDRMIVNERFKIYDDLQEAKGLFERLNESLTASWDLMYEFAKKYYEEFGNLEVERRYKTKEGYSLGAWIFTQRKVYKGEQNGLLGEDRIKKLEDIGMVWNSYRDLSWERYFAEAKKYYEKNGDLNVPARYITESGLKLGAWICNLRTYRKNGAQAKCLTEVRIKALDDIGMIWEQNDWLWDKYFVAAQEYFIKNGNLDIDAKFVTGDGLRLGAWIAKQRCICRGTAIGKALDADKVNRLNSIGMIWNKSTGTQWEAAYSLAEEYFRKNGNLNIPSTFITNNGYRLGAWVAKQRDNKDRLSEERRKKLDAIGMIWIKPDPWDVRFALAEAYYKKHGNLNIPPHYTVDGVWLGRWLNLQKQIYRGEKDGECLSSERVEKLESIGISWRTSYDIAWCEQYSEACLFFRDNGHLNVPSDYIGRNGKKLSVWIVIQRGLYKKGKLTEERITKLESIGMIWDLDDPWEIAFSHAVKYYEETGNLLVDKSFECEDGFKLGVWVVNQRAAYNHPSKYRKLSIEQVVRLEKIGMLWQVSKDRWEKNFAIAKKYYDTYGHLRTSKNEMFEGLKINDWLVEQRKHYRKEKLSKERIEKLNSIGMVWVFDDKWEIGFEHAETYLKENGDLLVIRTYVCADGYKLGQWIQGQRCRYNNPETNHPLKDYQIKRLESIGMQWCVQGAEWEEHYILAKQYFETYGNLKVKREFKFDDSTFNLYKWLITQRSRYRKGELSQDKIEKLTSIGMDWGNGSGDEIAVADVSSDSKRVAV